MIWFTLLYCMLWVAVVMSCIATISAWSIVIDDTDDLKMAGMAIFGTFFTVFLGWALWAVYPFTAIALGG